jgi:hypothetical protein
MCGCTWKACRRHRPRQRLRRRLRQRRHQSACPCLMEFAQHARPRKVMLNMRLNAPCLLHLCTPADMRLCTGRRAGATICPSGCPGGCFSCVGALSDFQVTGPCHRAPYWMACRSPSSRAGSGSRRITSISAPPSICTTGCQDNPWPLATACQLRCQWGLQQ